MAAAVQIAVQTAALNASDCWGERQCSRDVRSPALQPLVLAVVFKWLAKACACGVAGVGGASPLLQTGCFREGAIWHFGLGRCMHTCQRVKCMGWQGYGLIRLLRGCMAIE
jgi:hypothetical protein